MSDAHLAMAHVGPVECAVRQPLANKTVSQIYAALGKHDSREYRALFSEDAIINYSPPFSHPFKLKLNEWMVRFNLYFHHNEKISVVAIQELPDRVIVSQYRAGYTWTTTRDGRQLGPKRPATVKERLSYFVRDGRIVRLDVESGVSSARKKDG